MNLLRAGSHKSIRHMLRNAMSSNVNIMIRGFATTAENLESEQVVESGDMSKAEELSRETNYTSLIDTLCKHDRIDDAYRVLNQLSVSGFSPSVDTKRDVILGFLRIGKTRKAFEMLNKIREPLEYISDWMESWLNRGLSDEMLINGLNKKARSTEINKNLLIFNYKKSLCRPILEYHLTLAENSSDDEFKSVAELVEGFCIKGLENVFDTLLKSNYKPDGIDDGIVYNLFIIAHCKHYNVDEAYIMYKEMVHYGFACHMFIVFALIKTLKGVNMVNELLWVIQNILRSCNLNDSEILKFLDEFNPNEPIRDSEAFFDVLAEKAKDGLFLKCSYAPPSA